MKYNGKEVYILKYRPYIDDFATLSNSWTNDHYRFRGNCSIVLKDLQSIKDKIKASKGTLQAGDTLYFGKTSEFPRFKLAESDFKRCIKIEKADCIVVGKINGTEYKYTVLEDELYYYLVDSNNTNYVYCNDSKKKSEWNNDWFEYIKKYNLFFGTEIKKIYSGSISVFEGGSAIDVVNIMDGTYKNLVLDQDVDSMVNTKLDVLTKDDVKAISEMLDSPDNSTKGIGLKMLCAYNVNSTPLTVRTLLGARNYLSSLSEWKSVGVQQVLNTINWGGFGIFPHSMVNIINPGYKTYTYTDYDKDLCKDAYIIMVKKYIDRYISELEKGNILSTFGINVKYTIE